MLGANGVPRLEDKLASPNGYRLPGVGNQIHFDSASGRVVAGFVLPIVRSEVGAGSGVYHIEHIAVEGRGQTGRVVVGSVQHVAVLVEVDAEQDAAV